MALTEGQRACIQTLDRPLVVAAGAGSGKTFTLTKRIVHALQSGYVTDIDQVCAITFTKKAAGELKSRIKAELRACGLVDQALKVDEAWISTIHGMCARILRAHAIELGIRPDFVVGEGAEVRELLNQAVETVLVQAQVESSSPAIDALFREYRARSSGFGVSVEGMLKNLVEAASAQADGADAFVLPGVSVNPARALDQALAVVEDLLALAEQEKESASRDKWLAETAHLVERARALEGRGNTSHAEALAALSSIKLAKNFGSKGFKEHVGEARGLVGAFVMEIRLGAAQEHLETLVSLARRALAEYSDLKRAEGVLDNNDLLVQAARAIQDHPAIAARYVDKFKLVMVDEFQDTDQMQVDMIKRLAGEGANRLCTVGDAQQSIYRFRGADVSVYRRHLDSVRSARHDSVIELSSNFRSHADVLSFVDRVFERPSMFGGEFMSLSAGRDETRVSAPYESDRPRILVQHTIRAGRTGSGQEACAVAARRIAGEFSSLAKAGHAPGEMVVLLGRMTNADVYAQALRDVGLPCVISGGSVFARTMEARIASMLVRVIANPYDTAALFNVLTSPLFALSAGDLLQAGGLEGFWREAFSGEEGARGFSPQLECALRVMGEARRAAGRSSVAQIVEQVAVRSGWLSRMEHAGAEGLASAGNLYKAIRMVQDVERAGAGGPVSVMRRFLDNLESSKEAPGALSVAGGNSVRIMTIHASKGLEFPIVAVAEVKENRAPSSRLLMASVGSAVYLSLDLGRTLDDIGDTVDDDAVCAYVLGEVAGEEELAAAVAEDAGALHRRLALRSFMAAGDEEEAKRLLYVALTRAKEAVVVSSIGTRTKDNPAGIPKSALAGVFEAISANDAALGQGTSHVEFGGSHPALVECVVFDPGDDDAEERGFAERGMFDIPVASDRRSMLQETFKLLREGVFSYSSISDAAHEGDVLARLAAAHAVSVDEASDEGRSFAPASIEPAGADAVVFDDDAWAADASAVFDSDRATDLGTAFHRLAQFSVESRVGAGLLVPPPAERIEALSRTCGLGGDQKARLSYALDRWFNSDIARDMSAFADLGAEVPFFVSVGDADADRAYLEGEIDLIGFSEGHARALVVDYKTGGSSDETAEELKRKHVLQASCYAYAIMLQGTEQVEAVFVRVEQGRADDPSQPQCVRYRFTSQDLPSLERAIAEVHQNAQ